MIESKVLDEDERDRFQFLLASFCCSSEEEIRQAKDSHHRTMVFDIEQYSYLTWICTERYLDRNVWCSCAHFRSFYLIVKYTPLQRYRPKVNVILSQLYRRKYFLISTITISAILASLLVLIQFGYSYYGSNLVSINILILEDKELEMGLFPFENYPFVDKVAIIVASTDKSLNGNYSKATSYLLAEDIEMTIFVLVARKRKNLFAI